MAVMLVCCLLGVICSLLNQGLALKCYECTATNPNCKDKVTDSMLIVCPSGFSECLKSTLEVSSMISVGRICSVPTSYTNQCTSATQHGLTATKCSCTTDGCNSSVPLAPSIPVGATALMLLTFTLLCF